MALTGYFKQVSSPVRIFSAGKKKPAPEKRWQRNLFNHPSMLKCTG